MAPEQARGKPVDQRGDIWAYGAVLFEALTGRRLFAGDTVPDTLARVLATEPDLAALPEATPRRLRELVQRCLVRDPRHRLQAIGDARVVLEEVLARPQGEAAAVAPARAQGRGRRAAVIAAGLLAALAAGIALGHFALPRRGATAGDAVSFERLTFRPGHFVNARFAPDGQTVFYSAAWEGRPREVFQARPGGGELALGLAGHELLAVSRSGDLALLLPRIRGANPYIKRGTLARVPASGGTPRELAEDVTWADLTADGKSFAVVRQIAGRWRLEFPLGTPLYETANRLFWPRIAPAGDSVALFEIEGDSVSVVLFARGGARRVLSSGWDDWWNLAWSASGREVWFGAAKAGAAAALYAVDLQGRVRPLLSAPGTLELHDVAPDGRTLVARVGFRLHVFGRGPGATEESNLSWHEASQVAGLSTDGRWLLLNEGSETEGGGLWAYLRSTDGAAPVRLGQGNPQELSPDGKWALAIRSKEIVALPTGAGEARSIETRFEVIAAARWLPDSERIVVAASEPGAAARLYVMGFGPEAPRPLGGEFPMSSQGRGHQPLTPLSPDGRSVALAEAGGGIRVVSLENGEARQVPGVGSNDLPIQWTADGRSLYVYDPGELPARISTVELATGRRAPWLEIMPRDPAGVLGIERICMTTDGRSYAYSYPHFLSDLYLVEGLR
jgi:Tol biopolymer transport system component